MRTEHVKPPWRRPFFDLNPFTCAAKDPRPNRRIPPIHIPGDQAHLCLSCQSVHTTACCPACDKGPSVLLSRWLKKPEGERQIIIMQGGGY